MLEDNIQTLTEQIRENSNDILAAQIGEIAMNSKEIENMENTQKLDIQHLKELKQDMENQNKEEIYKERIAQELTYCRVQL